MEGISFVKSNCQPRNTCEREFSNHLLAATGAVGPHVSSVGLNVGYLVGCEVGTSVGSWVIVGTGVNVGKGVGTGVGTPDGI